MLTSPARRAAQQGCSDSGVGDRNATALAATTCCSGMAGKRGIITPHYTMESHRLTAHGTMVLTVKKLGYAYGSKTPNIPDQGAYVALEQVLRARYPALHDLGIKHCWSGYVSGAYDFLPVLGAMGEKQNIFYTAGCSGHGLGTQSFIGLLLAKQINGRTPELLAALHTRRHPCCLSPCSGAPYSPRLRRLS